MLHSAFALAEAGSLIRTGVDEPRMTVRVLDGEAIDSYLRHAGDAAWTSVGAYQVEGLGIHLFERIAGDHSTVLGLPDPAPGGPVPAGCLHSDRASDEVHRDRAFAPRTSIETNLRIEKP